MIVKAALNQFLGLDAVSNINYDSEPIPLGDFDRISAILVVHKMFGGTTQNDRRLLCHPEVSNQPAGGWVQVPNAGFETNLAGSVQSVSEVHGAWLRFHFDFEITAGSTPGGVLFDMYVLVEKT